MIPYLIGRWLIDYRKEKRGEDNLMSEDCG